MTQHTSMHRILTAIAATAMAFGIFSWASSPNWDDAARKRKAELTFMEAQSAYSEGSVDDYLQMLQRAYDLDSTDLDIGAEWALVQLADDNLDSVAHEMAYQRIKRAFFAAPDNYKQGMVLAATARNMGHFDDLVRTWEMLDSTHPELNQPAEELAKAYLISYLVGDSTGYDKAIGIYDRLEQGAGKSIELSSQKIRAYAVKADTASIINEVDSLVRFAPNDPFTALFAGSNYQYLGDKEKALQYYNRACELDSTNGATYMARAELYLQNGDSVAYDREVFHALHSANLEVEAKIDIMKSYVSQLFTDRAQEPRIRELFTSLANMHPGEPQIYNLYSGYLYVIEDYAGASEALTYSVSLDPTDENSWTMLVQTLNLQKKYDESIDYAKQAIDKFPHNLYFPLAAAASYRLQDKLDDAIAMLDSTDVGDIKNPSAVSNFISFRGDLLAAKGDTLKALECYDEAINLDPENLLALNNAAYFMAENNLDLDKAEKYSSKVVKLAPDNPTYLDTYAWIFFKKKDYTLARQYIDMTLNLCTQPDSAVAVGIDELDDSADTVSKEIKHTVIDVETVEEDENALSAEVLEHAGDIYFMDGEPAKAVEFWIKAAALDPENELLQKKVKHKTYFYK